ncbi:two-component system, OmpR family, sensor histidine kinase PhoQ [Methylomarinovum caldicuralii]|uniref:histidine kinase n=1 Tax=Methylomarinovum caldicuralii TaxID=438856 RepID=A0AAU9BR62_9GAMM|nr:ATP-binding protein [Methylomarinovum caldicuralii]BCX81273.1 two-component system, OmpR family, sensor histidine kinase PhoQ [Methylomarinovum caldicuralii]
MTLSLHARLGIAAGAILIAFLGLAGIALERAFREAAEKATEERLQAYIYTLLATFEIDPGGRVTMETRRLDRRFSTPGSGLYGFIFLYDEVLWQSPSALGISVPSVRLSGGRRFFTRLDGSPSLWVLYQGITWETERGHPVPLVIAVATDAATLVAEVNDFRRTLWVWLGGLGVLLLGTQIAILRWSLKPLRTIAGDLSAIEAGRKQRLEGRYPRELQRLAANLNALLHSERAHLTRYRNTLADLAHSLKTPLAVLRGLEREALPADARRTLADQVARMQRLVDYQLQKAAAQGAASPLRSVRLRPVLERICASLDKVYRDKGVTLTLDCDAELRLPLDEGDLYELLGNLLDNAYKWCRHRVRVAADASGGEIRLCIEDDGHGIPPQMRQAVLERGVRADQSTHGHGIGLAVVNELVRLHGGTLRYHASPWSGAGWEIRLPVSS